MKNNHKDLGFVNAGRSLIIKLLLGLGVITIFVQSFVNNLNDILGIEIEVAYYLFVFLYFILPLIIFVIALLYHDFFNRERLIQVFTIENTAINRDNWKVWLETIISVLLLVTAFFVFQCKILKKDKDLYDNVKVERDSVVFSKYALWKDLDNDLLKNIREFQDDIASKNNSIDLHRRIDSFKNNVYNTNDTNKSKRDSVKRVSDAKIYNKKLSDLNNELDKIHHQIITGDASLKGELNRFDADLKSFANCYKKDANLAIVIPDKITGLLYQRANEVVDEAEEIVLKQWKWKVFNLQKYGMLWFMCLLFCGIITLHIIRVRLINIESDESKKLAWRTQNPATYKEYKKQKQFFELKPYNGRTEKLEKIAGVNKDFILAIVLLSVPFFRVISENDVNLKKPFLNISPKQLVGIPAKSDIDNSLKVYNPPGKVAPPTGDNVTHDTNTRKIIEHINSVEKKILDSNNKRFNNLSDSVKHVLDGTHEANRYAQSADNKADTALAKVKKLRDRVQNIPTNPYDFKRKNIPPPDSLKK